ncbi:DEAD/DEAH box helicase [Natronococcus jeotgali]|uniref:Type III restriction protein res subunit n=1 Tax=Natronococcus jeotgali DSM 18795 TaxID=1227498 RepID=L9XP76_9EURY|nr:helicase-related protein [Natronococcus jeotgali]ELY63599.1 type III restriction protein res subunit [Natronococcus jeotgali DSM 18795]
MGNTSKDAIEKQLNQSQNALENDILADRETVRYPEQIDWIGGYIARHGDYVVGIGTGTQVELTRENFGTSVRQPYLRGLRDLTGNRQYASALPDTYPLGDLIIEFSDLVRGLEQVSNSDDAIDEHIDPGEVLGRLIIRDLKRSTTGDTARLAQSLHSATTTPRELVEQLCSYPELAELTQQVLPDRNETGSLVQRLGAVKLSTKLWEHQREALISWLEDGANGYVNMATATGKTVLGLAAVGYLLETDSSGTQDGWGSLHPEDDAAVNEAFGGSSPYPGTDRSSNILIVTTDTLLGAQWSRLFEEHCETPPEYTKVVDNSITFPWGQIDIRAADSLEDVDTDSYRLAIFDEVHNYKSGAGWGEHLIEFIESGCPVLALTGSVDDELERRFENADTSFPNVYEYTHEMALEDGIIPDFSWSLEFVPIDPDESSTLEQLSGTAELAESHLEFDEGRVRLTDEALTDAAGDDVADDERLTADYSSIGSLANALTRVDDNRTAPTDSLDRLASGLSNRQPHWWNLRASAETIEQLAAEAMEEARPTLILTRSYAEANQVASHLYQSDAVKPDVMRALSQKQKDGHHETIQKFDNEETGHKILIGPGDRIGTGVDIKTVEVGINLARPGTGLSSTLIQRLGRLLRKASGKHDVSFHHILGLPPRETLIPSDGKMFVNNISGFFSQVKEPQTNSVMKLPEVSVHSDIRSSVRFLERTGSTVPIEDESDGFKSAYVSSIRTASHDAETLVIEREWYNELLDDTVTDQSVASTKMTNTGTTEKQESRQTTEQTDGRSSVSEHGHDVTIDGAVLALVDRNIAATEAGPDSRTEFITSAMESYLEPFIGASGEPSVASAASERTVQVDADPVLNRLLQEAADTSESHETVESFVKAAILDSLGVSNPEATVAIDNYARYEFIVEKLIESEEIDIETESAVVESAVLKTLEVE